LHKTTGRKGAEGLTQFELNKKTPQTYINQYKYYTTKELGRSPFY